MEQQRKTTPKQVLARIVFNEQVMPGVYLLWIEAPGIARDAQPGQFVMLKCRGGAFLRRPLSIHKVDEDGKRVAFLFAVVGKGTDWLARQKAGEEIDLLGPLGNGFDVLAATREILLVAGGLGLAPLVFLAEWAKKRGLSVNLAYGTEDAHRYARELLPKGINLVDFTEDGSCGRRGLVTECIPDFIDGVDQLFVCGPIPMYRTLAKQAQFKNKLVQVSLEVRIACGLGVCYGCTIKAKTGLKQVCHDGPVFNLEEVIWEEMVEV